MVVSTERPPATTVTEALTRRWQITNRKWLTGRPTTAAGQPVAQAQLKPWKP